MLLILEQAGQWHMYQRVLNHDRLDGSSNSLSNLKAKKTSALHITSSL